MASFDPDLCWNKICSALSHGNEPNLRDQFDLAKANGWINLWNRDDRMLSKAVNSNPLLVLTIFEYMPAERIPPVLLQFIKNYPTFNLDIIKYLFERYDASSLFRSDACEFLLRVIYRNYLDFLQFYIHAGLRLIEPPGKSAVYEAAWSKNIDMVKFVLGLGYSPYTLTYTYYINTPIFRPPYFIAMHLNQHVLCKDKRTSEIELFLRPYAFIPKLCDVLFLALFWFCPKTQSYELRNGLPIKDTIRF